MLRAVIDTNLVVSGVILKRGLPHELLNAWHAADFFLITSDPLVVEYRSVLRRPQLAQKYRFSLQEASRFLNLVDMRAIKASSLQKPPVQVRDPKDEIVLATALAGQADYLITGDGDLLVLDGDQRLNPLRIVTVRDFLALLRSGHTGVGTPP